MANLTGVLRRDGAVVRYRDLAGGRRPVVFTHGAGMDHRMFDVPARVLHQAGHRVVTWDLRGHGESTLDAGSRFTATAAFDDLVSLLDHLGLERPVLVGHSLGGNLSQAFVRRLPDRAHGLVVVDATWNAGPLGTAERFLLGLAAPSLALVPASRLPGLMARASAVTPEGIAESEATFARIPKRVFLDVWRATVSLIAPEPGYRTPVPLGLVRGEHDRTGNIATAMPRWAAAEAVAEHVIPDAGHNVTLDAADATAAVIRDLVDRWEAEA
ncbi:alpha/beta hydrolase [Actinosynnema sp. NPDC047251]|uniref:Alpha/beta hydrolase fold containing protein n=1 Tax=Saccharothrix espanaensis (strain ATCC 51144 / DSM 44229 / JCM 9112 / NBRC 15066 / NRRL 15764) TaxID=1179773 RepID=K0K303_SACES|nr:alpha/beta hydrolase [Saccharothrix espanaensis]CCH31259.1 alpha/beta hydrolase fold containing protein [Saccharothrix espanaensis DSM 44229]